MQCNRGVLCNVTVDPNIRHGVQVVGRLHPPTCCTLTLLLHCTYTCTCTCTCEYAHVPSHAHAHLHTDLADSTLQPEPSPCYCTALMVWLANMQAHANVHVHKHTCTRSLTCMPLHMPNAHAPAVDPKAVDQAVWPRDNPRIGLHNRSMYYIYAPTESTRVSSRDFFFHLISSPAHLPVHTVPAIGTRALDNQGGLQIAQCKQRVCSPCTGSRAGGGSGAVWLHFTHGGTSNHLGLNPATLCDHNMN